MPAKKHDFTKTEIKAGLFVLASVLVLFLFVATVQGLRPPAEMHRFHAAFTDVSGLNPGADVRFGGSKAGRVTHIELDETDQSLIRVVFEVNADVPVNAGCEAFITQTTLTASKHLGLSTGEKHAPLLEDGAELPTQQGDLFEQASALARSVQSALSNVMDLLGVAEAKDKEAQGEQDFVTLADITGGVGDTLEEGKGFVQDARGLLDDSGDNIEAILEKVEGLEDRAAALVEDVHSLLTENRTTLTDSLSNVEDITKRGQDLMARVQELAGELDGIVEGLENTLANTEALSADAYELLSERRPELEEMLLDLREAMRHLKRFAQTVADHPEAVIRGKSPEGRR